MRWVRGVREEEVKNLQESGQIVLHIYIWRCLVVKFAVASIENMKKTNVIKSTF